MSEFFWTFDFDHYFQPEEGFTPSKWVIHLLFNSAPRKFKNLGTDAFIASRLTKFSFGYFKMYMQ